MILHKQPTIYAVINQKGGVGKTTTAAALWAGLTSKGYRVLAVDLDGVTSLELLTKEATAAEAVQHTQSGDIIPASRALAGADSNITETGKEYRLKEALEPIKGTRGNET